MLNTRTAEVAFALTYRSEWQDGYGAQGWKLDLARNDPTVVACTAYTGDKTPTSVLVHDILDHLVSGFPLSGYANEARATAMHGLRNGIEVRSSYEWMADELLNATGRKSFWRNSCRRMSWPVFRREPDPMKRLHPLLRPMGGLVSSPIS